MFRISESRRLLCLVLAVCLAPSAAFAHTGIGESSGLMHGLMHPLWGLDHQLAMILVGIFAYQLGGRALWLVPLTFVTVMALGGLLGVNGMALPFVEIGIALSVVILGAIVAFGIKAPVAAAMALVGLFAIFHGHAHGTEMPLDASGAAYGLGFMLATALLHAAGIVIGLLIGMAAKPLGQNVYRAVGGLASLAGVALLLGALST
ncbi:MAG TPA: HupE/UreJ family protein [Alphaproteobacteria bacterium]|nr:HupE/UreJ family protein [Alphaproteobacteria bacterium]